MHILLSFFLILLPTWLAATDVIVSIPPTRYIVQRIAGNSLAVQVLVPPGMSPHSFEPNAKEMLELVDAKVWFQIGECFEARASSAFPLR